MRKVWLLLAAFSLLSVGFTPAAANSSIKFAAPVLLTQPTWGGYEPGVVVDNFNNVWVTAHKQNHGDAVSPDSDPANVVPARSESWMWWSKDSTNFQDAPGVDAVNSDRLTFGDEGDLAIDGKNRVYNIDTSVADIHLTRWKVTGNGVAVNELSTPAIGTAEPVDDRPWVVAHGDGVVAYFGNEGDKASYPLGTSSGCAGGGGRYTVYMSYDAGQTFDNFGCTLPGSGWCRPAADPTPGSHYIYAFCGDDGGADGVVNNPGDPGYEKGTFYSFVSADDGHSWNRYTAGSFNAANGEQSWPSVNVAPDGSLYALNNDAETVPSTATSATVTHAHKITANHLVMYHSTDHGKTWTSKEVTPWAQGRYRYTWSHVAPDGTLGMAFYYSADAYSNTSPTSNWYLYAGTSPGWGQPFDITSVAPNLPVGSASSGAFGDFFQIAFGPDSVLHVVFTVVVPVMGITSPADTSGLDTDIYYAKQLPGTHVAPAGKAALKAPAPRQPNAAAPPPAAGTVKAASRASLPNTAGLLPSPLPLVPALVLPLLAIGLGRYRRHRSGATSN